MLRGILVLSLVVLVSALLINDSADALLGRWAPTSLTAVSNAGNTTCAVANGKVYCWGDNQTGQLGIGSTDTADHPLPLKVTDTGVLSGKVVTSVAVGTGGYACVIASNWPYCWGANQFGSLGNNTTTNTSVPVAVVDTGGVLTGKTITHISAGFSHACVIANAKPYCWGSGGNGSLGNNSSADSLVPVAVLSSGALSGVSVTSITSGSSHSCVSGTVGGVGRVYCWGSAVVGQLGDGSTTNSLVPVAVSTTSGELLTGDVLSVGPGSSYLNSCVLTKPPTSKVYCWGFGSSGQLGNNSTSTALVPVGVVQSSGALLNKSVSSVYVGMNRACALDTTGRAYCWGAPLTGDNTTSQQNVPVAVFASGVLNGISLQSLGVGSSTCGVGANSRLYCWGDNTKGELGDNSTTARNVPVSVLAQSNVTNSSYRFYEPAGSITPGAPMSATNTPVQLSSAGQAFRLRMGISPLASSTTPIDIRAGDASLKLQFAEKSAATCSAQSTGFADVTTTTKVGWHTTSGVTHDANISTHANDPSVAGTAVAQKYRSAAGNFSNTVDINQGQTGLWDFSLADKAMVYGGSYCLRIVYSSGTTLEGAPVSYAEVRSANDGFSMNIVNANGVAVAPGFPLVAYPWTDICNSSLGNLFVGASRKLRVYNATATSGWTVSIAATNGPGAVWQTGDGTRKYDFNDISGSTPGCNSGSDGDGLAGALQVYTDLAAITASTGCTSTSVSKGTTATFTQGSQDSLTLMSASAGAQLGCYWDLGTTILQQQIPAYQPPGEYSIDMTISAVAS